MNASGALAGIVSAVGFLLPLLGQAAEPPALSGFDADATRVMADWQVPGMAVGVVHGDTVVLSRAYGYRDATGRRPVTPQTLFALGSITKSLTVSGLGILADEGLLDWDKPVRAYLPEFRLMDAEAGAAITARDMVTHRSGLPRHDVLWYAGAFGRDELVRRLRFLKPTRPLGTTFQYQNLMVMTAGYLAGRLAGTSWEDFTRRRLLQPLAMTDSRLSFAEFRDAPDRTSPHFLAGNRRTATPLRDTDPIGPASALYSNLPDMLTYLRFHMGVGRIGPRRLLSRANAEAMRTPRIAVPGVPGAIPFDDAGETAYGMGFFLSTYRGHRLVYHPGVIDGYKGLLSFMPDAGIGVIVLTNLSGDNQAPDIVTRNLYDRLLGLDRLPWAERFMTAHRQRVSRPRAADRGVPPPPSRNPAAYAGVYEHPAYGPIHIIDDGGGLKGRFHRIGFAMRHIGGDVWQVPETAWPLRQGLRITFLTDAGGNIGRLKTPLADGPTYPYKVGDVIFRRVSDPAAR
jgi:CubicO group peptidase (beta-lactamase class C family)